MRDICSKTVLAGPARHLLSAAEHILRRCSRGRRRGFDCHFRGWPGGRANACPYLLVGWLWFLGTLVPVIGLVQVGGAALADRYTYFPSIGIFLAVALGHS